jgi:hypothetical protein
MGRTLIDRWDEVSQCINKFIMDLVESGCNVPSHLRTHDSSVIGVVHVQETDGVFGLKELVWLRLYERFYAMYAAIRTASSGSRSDKILSGAFIISSISSEPEGTTIHWRKVGTLNRPGLI